MAILSDKMKWMMKMIYTDEYEWVIEFNSISRTAES